MSSNESLSEKTRTLMIMRHAKSSWDDASLVDHDRPLNRRGLKAAVSMGRFLRTQDWRPDLVLCSTATRAMQTWEHVSHELEVDPSFQSVKQLYMANAPTIVQVIRRFAANESKVMLFGHNPGLHEFVEHWTGPLEKFPTGAVAKFEFAISDWSELELNLPCRSWTLTKPKEL